MQHFSWWDFLVLGCILQPIGRYIVRTIWLWFVHRSEHTVKIWYAHKKAAALEAVREADEWLDS